MKINLRLPKRCANSSKGNIKFSITFKMTATYTLLFGLILAASVAVLTTAFTTYEFHIQNLDHIASFVMERVGRPHPPDGKQFDFDSFASANRVYIEIKDMDTGEVTGYGENKSTGRLLEVVRNVDVPRRRMMVKVVDQESQGLAGISTGWYVAILAFLMLLTALFGAMKTRKMLRPVAAMTQTAQSISASDLSLRIDEVQSHDELRELAETFNGMLDRIQEAYEKQNRFVSDASHELRTPLSVISGYANLLRRWGSDDRAVLDESVQKIIEETDNMQQLVNRLLFLARADKKTQHVKFERFDLGALLSEITEETRLIDEQHSISSEIEDGVFLTADIALIKQAVRAVVENSIKYTPAGGSIKLFCRDGEQNAEFGVRDTGIGIAEKDLPHIFDRFYKADAARTRAKGSSGLGLSIVKWIIDRHKGTITVESRPGSGAEFTICLPKTQETME